MIAKEIKSVVVIGIGYVGLPLTVELAKYYRTFGLDISKKRISNLKKGHDDTFEVNYKTIKKSTVKFTNDPNCIGNCQMIIITVPTPIDEYKRPDLKFLKSASRTVGKKISKGSIVVYESTVYPGATEEICVPIIEKYSRLKFNNDFFVGYSPERINPGDKKRTIRKITKVVSGSNKDICNKIKDVYEKVTDAGVYKAKNIKIAEAAKVIENVQRDINIALVNELSILFDKLGVDTTSVLEAAGTKWNFLPFKPGLVGGHCIGVDPYYLTHKAKELNLHTELISAGRKINDSMAEFATSKLIKNMKNNKLSIGKGSILILGFTFKENCPDFRNTQILNLVLNLKKYGFAIEVYDPWIKPNRTFKMINFVDKPKKGFYSAIILAVPHDEFKKMGAEDIRKFGRNNHIFFDLKSIYKLNESDLRL